MKKVTFGFPCSLIWFSLDPSGGFWEQEVKVGDSLEVEELERASYVPRNSIDFISEYKAIRNGFYARIHEREGETIKVENGC